MRLMYLKPRLKDLTIGSRIAFVRQFRNLTQEDVSEKLGLNVDYNVFFCTTSALENGIEEVNPIISLIEESKLRNVKKCLLITPYNAKLGKEITKMLEDNKIKIIKNINLDLLHTADYFNYGINKLEKLIEKNYLKEYENIIISCTNLPTIGVIENLEDKLNTQIISSNSSLFAKIKRDNNI